MNYKQLIKEIENTKKNLRNPESIKAYIEEVKEYLEAELSKVEYNKREKRFYDFILNPNEILK